MQLSQTTVQRWPGSCSTTDRPYGAGHRHAQPDVCTGTNSGALVFGAGTVQWSWGLDANHDRGIAAADVRMQQATVNLFADMGVQPATLQIRPGDGSGIDRRARARPRRSVAANGATLDAGHAGHDHRHGVGCGGGIVAGVEVSTDGGTTWQPATGTTTWTFNWTVAGSGTVTIKSRAFDDSGNVETPSAGVTVTVNANTHLSLQHLEPRPYRPAAARTMATRASVELGTQFRADINGFITGVRFYKASPNTGTHTGSLWTSAGAAGNADVLRRDRVGLAAGQSSPTPFRRHHGKP